MGLEGWRKRRAAWSVSPWRCLPLSLGGQPGAFPAQEGQGPCGGPNLEVTDPNSAHCTSCASAFGLRGRKRICLSSSSSAPRARAEIPEIPCVPVGNCRVWLGAAPHTKARPACGGWAQDRKGSVCLRTESPCRGEDALSYRLRAQACAGVRSCSG